ncbi:MAG: acyl-CoA dehydrogenase family protein [Nocardioides sp.]
MEKYAENHGLDRQFWLDAGEAGLLGLEIPEEFGGAEAGDYRFNAVLTEELAKVNMTLPSCLGIHADIMRAVPRAPDQRGAEAALAAQVRHRRDSSPRSA